MLRFQQITAAAGEGAYASRLLIAIGLVSMGVAGALMLGQVEGRASELAVRAALGADRGRLDVAFIKTRAPFARLALDGYVAPGDSGFFLLTERHVEAVPAAPTNEPMLTAAPRSSTTTGASTTTSRSCRSSRPSNRRPTMRSASP